MTNAISPHYLKGLSNLLAHWQAKTANLSEEDLKAFRADYLNIFSYLQNGLQLPPTQEAALNLFEQLYVIIERQGQWHQWLALFNKALDIVDKSNHLLWFKLVHYRSRLLRLTSQLDQALVEHQQALQIAQHLPDNQLLIGKMYFELSTTHLRKRDVIQAQAFGEKALAIFETVTGIEEWKAGICHTLSGVALAQKAYKKAQAYINQAIAYQLHLPAHATHLARMYTRLGSILQAQKVYGAAEQQFEQALSLLESTDSVLDKIRVQNCLGRLYYEQDNFSQSQTFFERVVVTQAVWDSGDFALQASVTQNMGNVLVAQEQFDLAEPYLLRSIELSVMGNDAVAQANTLGTLGEVKIGQGQIQTACKYYYNALTLVSAYPKNTWANDLFSTFSEQLDLLNCP